MIKVDWANDYNKDFTCPKCNEGVLCLAGSNAQNKRCFRCSKCKRKTNDSISISKGYFDSRLKAYGLACPNENCNSRIIVLK